ncbi:MAG: bifunctional riboflavin kinase/FAD synthetase [Ruminococcaceae bacterium]|nr:bifunctional riboflavin kinase/FAD synthetase [Oscillospiraceae bacterium]
MKMITKKSFAFSCDDPLVVALGCFDGVHKGHSRLISEAVAIARQKEISSAVFSFTEPPKSYFSPEPTPLLTPFYEKKRLMRTLSPDLFVCVPFNKNIAMLSAEDFFCDILLKKLNAAHIVCGFDYHFGRGGKGDAALLDELCKKHGISLSVIAPVVIDGITVSSSEIRRLLGEGDVKTAAALLGRRYSIYAPVVSGQHLGRTLGFPTINQLFEKNSTPLRRGVYLTRVRIGYTAYHAITNVGVRPTVDGATFCAETNIFGFEGDLYTKSVRVEFVDFIRPEKKFNSVGELTAQVLDDIKNAKDRIKH